jgi:hypothetical protein
MSGYITTVDISLLPWAQPAQNHCQTGKKSELLTESSFKAHFKAQDAKNKGWGRAEVNTQT